MKLTYIDVTTGKELDQITLTNSGVKFKTNKARSTVNAVVRRYGLRVAQKILKSWSNGYVATTELPE